MGSSQFVIAPTTDQIIPVVQHFLVLPADTGKMANPIPMSRLPQCETTCLRTVTARPILVESSRGPELMMALTNT